MAFVVVLATLLAQATPAPSPLPSASPCQQDPDVLHTELPHDFDIQEIDRPLTATIAVVIAPDGSVRKATLYKSSGDPSFDMASVYAARGSKYRPKIVDCKSVESLFYFKTSVTPQQ